MDKLNIDTKSKLNLLNKLNTTPLVIYHPNHTTFTINMNDNNVISLAPDSSAINDKSTLRK